MSMHIDDLLKEVGSQNERMRAARQRCDEGIAWYPYDILANVVHLDSLLTDQHRDLGRLAQGMPVADIGSADGDLAFALEDLAGWQMDIIDTAATNMNGLQGARALRDELGSQVSIHDVDLDRQFTLPRERYGLILLLGILYHLQNPFYVLRELASRCSYCLLSTRVARFAGSQRTPIGDLPVAYLVAPHETNNDPTNYWIFSPEGLLRLVGRAGWQAVNQMNVGNTTDSDPSGPANDERMFLLLQSTAQ
jgi:tRNA (mo5U34)-methyltransferase